jgi:pimeloyl-ACP methyl ester carboxylesterase
MIYLPARELDRTPSDLGLAYEDLTLTAIDGARLHAWFLPGRAAAPVTVLFLHGNAGNISHRFDKLAVLRALGADVLIVDYRGYGRSTGRPDEGGTYRDADAAYEHLTGKRALDPHRLVLYGESLGAAVAVDLAARRPVGGLIMESAFSSAVEVGRELFPFLPASLLVRNRYDNVAKIGRVRAPVLLLHSRDDEFFGWHHPQRLYEAAHTPKQLIELRGGHNDAFLVSGAAFAEALKVFLADVARERVKRQAP